MLREETCHDAQIEDSLALQLVIVVDKAEGKGIEVSKRRQEQPGEQDSATSRPCPRGFAAHRRSRQRLLRWGTAPRLRCPLRACIFLLDCIGNAFYTRPISTESHTTPRGSL